MRIEILTQEQDSELTDFLDSLGRSDDGSFVLGYHYPEYRDAILLALRPGSEACYLAARDAEGVLCGVLPGIIGCDEGTACYNSLPFFGPNVGVLASGEHPNYVQIAEALVKTAIDVARAKNALTATFYTAFVPQHCKSRPFPELPLGDVARVSRQTQYVDLHANVEWPSVRRRNIRKASTGGVKVETDLSADQVEEVLAIYALNCAEYGIPQKPFESIRHLISTKLATLYAALCDGRVVAGLIVVWGPRTASYYLPCCASQFRSLHPGTLLVDRVCVDARERGVRYLNFESSPGPHSGVYRYKQAWGAIEANYELIVARFCSLEELRNSGYTGIVAAFPFFFVYPFSQLPLANCNLKTDR